MIGVLIGVVAVVVTFLLKGVSPAVLINMPSIMIVLVGTAGATIASFGLGDFKRVPKLMLLGMKGYQHDPVTVRDQLVAFAERARRDGLLSLETEAQQVDDPFLRRGLQMVIDGIEPETVEEVLELDTEALQERHARGVQMFQQMAGYAPTFGILGAVMGLVAVMAHLSEPEKLGAGIQVAFIATLLAVGIANIVLQPIALALKSRSAEEVKARSMALTGIMAIQAGDNPRIVAQKLESHMPPALRGARAEKASAKVEAVIAPAAEGAA